MKERPILFSAPMVVALLAGTKTQTRRVMKPQPHPEFIKRGLAGAVPQWPVQDGVRFFMNDGLSELVASPLGAPGDRLWVKETHAYVRHTENYECGGDDCFWQWEPEIYGEMTPENLKLNPRTASGAATLCFFADGEDENPSELYPTIALDGRILSKAEIHWRPSIFMFRWMSRISLEIMAVRAEPLHSISEEDARAEGGPEILGYTDEAGKTHGWATYREWYAWLWDAINGPGAWAKNPWVWAITVKKVC